MTVIYTFPSYTAEIINTLNRLDWFVHAFDTDDVYNPAGYVHSQNIHGTEFQFHTDLNVYQYIISAYKKQNKSQFHRDAIAVVVFAKITNIQFEPNLSIYEKINYSEQCSDTILDDLHLFKRIDNADLDELALFALGFRDDFNIPDLKFKGREVIRSNLVKYERLKGWDSIYLHVLKICDLEQTKDLSKEDKMSIYLDWCYQEFLHSLAALCFAIKIWGKSPQKKVFKYQADKPQEQRKKALVNMTWDLFLLHDFFEHWKEKTSRKEAVYVSNDKAFREILKLAISIQKSGDSMVLKNELSQSLINRINSVLHPLPKSTSRKVDIIDDFANYRAILIQGYELKLLNYP